MNRLIITIVICAAVMLLACLFAGCSLLKPRTSAITTDIPTPDPVRQLWTAARKSNWLVTVSILGIAAGVFATTNGATKLGLSSIAAASVSLFMALAVARFALWMAVFGLVGSLAAALFSILARRKALVEIIKGVQVVKTELHQTPGAFINKKLGENQSITTKMIVNDIKNSLKLKGEIR